MKKTKEEYEEGFYQLTSKTEPEPLVVYGYKCSDLDGAFVFGFNIHDGGGLLPLDDLNDTTTVTPVTCFNETMECTVGKIVESRLKAELEKINEEFSQPLLVMAKDPTPEQKINTLFLLMKLNSRVGA